MPGKGLCGGLEHRQDQRGAGQLLQIMVLVDVGSGRRRCYRWSPRIPTPGVMFLPSSPWHILIQMLCSSASTLADQKHWTAPSRSVKGRLRSLAPMPSCASWLQSGHVDQPGHTEGTVQPVAYPCYIWAGHCTGQAGRGRVLRGVLLPGPWVQPQGHLRRGHWQLQCTDSQRDCSNSLSGQNGQTRSKGTKTRYTRMEPRVATSHEEPGKGRVSGGVAMGTTVPLSACCLPEILTLGGTSWQAKWAILLGKGLGGRG